MGVVLVLGGSGFIGRQVCREALKQGHTVYSMTRSGQAPPGVHAIRGDAADPAAYPQLSVSSVRPDIIVVHCIGTLFEHGKMTYKRASFDTTTAMLDYLYRTNNISNARVRYVSADDFKGLAKWFIPRYFEWKRAAESAIQRQLPADKILIVRPGLVMGWERWPTMVIGFVNNVLSMVSAGVIPRAVRVETLAKDLLQ